jgi:hypothetical protein
VEDDGNDDDVFKSAKLQQAIQYASNRSNSLFVFEKRIGVSTSFFCEKPKHLFSKLSLLSENDDDRSIEG